MIDVLLISPCLPSNDPNYYGDHAYTDTLLKYPPAGVNYHHYEHLIASGQIRRGRFWKTTSYYLKQWGILPPDIWVEALDSDFIPDILHIFGYSARVRFPDSTHYPPVILGVSTGSYSDLKYYHSWQPARIERARRLKRIYLQIMRAHDSSLQPQKAAHVLVWSDFSRQMHLQEDRVRSEKISVLPPGLPTIQTTMSSENKSNVITFLFVGRDFERKNGHMVLEAFRRIHTKYPNTRLLLIGQPRDSRLICEPGLEHHLFVTRGKLLHEIYPQADVLLLPSKAEGFGLVILEAMSMGMPAIAVDAWAMPEIIRNGENGFLIQPGSLDDLIKYMQIIAVNSNLRGLMKERSKSIFQKCFSIQAHNQKLESVYQRALSYD